MTEAQFELLLAANREQYEELQAIHHALRRLRGISYAVFIILCIIAGASMIWLGLAGLALRDVHVYLRPKVRLGSVAARCGRAWFARARAMPRAG